MNTLLSQEVCNRYERLSPAERILPHVALMRITVEVTRELMQKSPDSVDEFLRMVSAQAGSVN